MNKSLKLEVGGVVGNVVLQRLINVIVSFIFDHGFSRMESWTVYFFSAFLFNKNLELIKPSKKQDVNA